MPKLLRQTGWKRSWRNDEKWELIEVNEIPENWLPIRIGNEICYFYQNPNDELKLMEMETESGMEMETAEMEMETESGMETTNDFWESFLDEEMFNSILNDDWLDKIPKPTIDYNEYCRNHKLTIHQSREMTLRSILSMISKYEDEWKSDPDYIPELLRKCKSTLYMGVLEYAGYKPEEKWNLFSEPLTFTEHRMLGLELC